MKNNDFTTVTYSFVDNTKIVQPVNKGMFTDSRGRKITMNEVHNIFRTTASDKGAISYSVETTESQVIDNTKPVYFTATERKYAKRDYKEFKRNNPEQFHKERNQLVSFLTDRLSKRLRFNLTNLSTLN